MRYAIVTPSYEPDFERCQMLCESVNRYAHGDWRHYVIVDRRDEQLFRTLRGPRTELILKERWLPWWIRRMPFSRRIWLSFKTLPLRGWIVQQLMKLSVGAHLTEDAFIFVDSDLSFCRPFDVSMFERESKLRLFRAMGGGDNADHRTWHASAARILGLPPRDDLTSTYIGAITTWRRDHLVEMYAHIEKTHRQRWFRAIVREYHLAEYILYGTYIDRVRGDDHLHYHEDTDICLISWEHDIQSDADLDRFFAAMKPEHIAVMLSAKLNIPVSQYRERFPYQPVSSQG